MIMAIFVALMAFAAATVVGLRARHDLQTSRLGARKVQRQLAVQGAVNHLLSLLRRGQGQQYDQANPLQLELGQVSNVKVWSFQDPGNPDVLHVQAEHLGSVSTKSLVVKPPRESVVYFEDGNQLFSRQPGALDWTTVPAPPDTVFDLTGTASPLPGGEVQNLQTNHDGKLFVEVFQGGANWRQGVSMWDNENQGWSTLPPLPQFQFSGGVPQAQSQYQPVQLDGADDDRLYSLTSDGLAVYSTDTGNWSYYPGPPGERGRFAAAGGDQFVVQMHDRGSGTSWLSRFQNDTWSVISIPDASLTPRGLDADGRLYAEHGSATKVWEGQGWQTLSTPSELQGFSLRAVDAEGSLIYADPNGEIARWDLDSTVEEYTIPAGTQVFFSDWRQLGGGGQLKPGALPVLEVVSSY